MKPRRQKTQVILDGLKHFVWDICLSFYAILRPGCLYGQVTVTNLFWINNITSGSNPNLILRLNIAFWALNSLSKNTILAQFTSKNNALMNDVFKVLSKNCINDNFFSTHYVLNIHLYVHLSIVFSVYVVLFILLTPPFNTFSVRVKQVIAYNSWNIHIQYLINKSCNKNKFIWEINTDTNIYFFALSVSLIWVSP